MNQRSAKPGWPLRSVSSFWRRSRDSEIRREGADKVLSPDPPPWDRGQGGGVSRLRFPPGPHLRSSPFQPTPTPSAGSHQEVCRNRNLRGLVFGEKAPGPWWAGPQALGARAPSPLETWPTGAWGLDRHSHKFTSSCCISNR